MEKIDIHGSKRDYPLAREKLLGEKAIHEDTRKLILRFLDDRALGRVERVDIGPKGLLEKKHYHATNRKKSKRIGLRTCIKNLYSLKVPARFFGSRALDSLTVEDIEKFVAALDSNSILSNSNRSFSEPTKSVIKKVLIQFLRWYFGESKQRYYEMTYWIDTGFKEKEMPSLDEEEVVNLLGKCTSLKQKVLIVCLFDGGFRIEEFLNLRNSDVRCTKSAAPLYRMNVRVSKTKTRTVAMYWKLSYETISQWLESKGHESSDRPFYDVSYGALRMSLTRLGAQYGQRLHAHLFRHSSVTHYAKLGWNEFRLNYRYGWSQTSDESRRYVERSKLLLEDDFETKKYEENQIGQLKSELGNEVQEKNLLLEALHEKERRIETLEGKFEALLGEVGNLKGLILEKIGELYTLETSTPALSAGTK